MVLKFDENKRVLWFNGLMSFDDYKKIKGDRIIWLETPFPEIENKNGCNAVFYVNEDIQSIRVEYEQISEPEPTQLDIIEQEVKKKNADIATAAIDAYTLELVQEGIL